MAKLKIRIQVKGSTWPLVTSDIDAEEAERFLQEEVLPKLGKEGAIGLPGLVVNAADVIAAETFTPGSATMPAAREPS